MMKSLYSGVSGLKVHNQRMDVIGNNIANVNTTAFKSSTVTFKDVFYQTKQSASGGSDIKGGVNPKQIGYGAALGTINQIMTQSGLTYSDNIYDCALQGEGFFQVMDPAGNIYYTRNGVFTADNNGNLTDPNGYIVLGVRGDPTGVGPSSQRIQLSVPSVQNNVASATKEINGYEVTISANGYGPNGNISVTLAQADTPFATLNGNNLAVQLDLTQDFASQADFEAAVNDAIRAGGVNLDQAVLPLSIKFNTTPADYHAVRASNRMEFIDRSNPTEEVDDDGGTRVTYPTFNLNFETMAAGAFGNAYEVDVKLSSTILAPTAKWSNNVITITLPEFPDPTKPVDLNLIQDALNEAAGMKPNANNKGGWDPSTGNDQKKFIVTQVQFDNQLGVWQTVAAPEAESLPGDLTIDVPGSPDTDITDWNFAGTVGTTTKRVGMANGTDNFYSSMAKSMATLPLQNGRFESNQTHADLDLVFIDTSGNIYGEHPVHGRLPLGRIDLVTFENPTGLDQVGTSYWKTSLASGEPTVKLAEQDGAASVINGALEMSNVDLSQEFSDMIITQRGFQANSRIITVSDTMLEELINLKR